MMTSMSRLLRVFRGLMERFRMLTPPRLMTSEGEIITGRRRHRRRNRTDPGRRFHPSGRNSRLCVGPGAEARVEHDDEASVNSDAFLTYLRIVEKDPLPEIFILS